MWAAGVIDLGLTPAALWDLTPREFDILFERHLEREDRANRRAAMIAVHIANFAGKTLAKPIGIDDILRPGKTRQLSDLERFRDQIEPRAAVDRYIERLRAEDPQAEITMSRAILDAVAQSSGAWTKLGTREGLLESASVQAMMRGDLK